MTGQREFDCVRDRLHVGGKWIRLNDLDLLVLRNAERKNLLPPGFFDQARKGMDREPAITHLLTAIRNSVSEHPAALVELLVILLNRKVERRKGNRQTIAAPHQGMTPNGRLLRR